MCTLCKNWAYYKHQTFFFFNSFFQTCLFEKKEQMYLQLNWGRGVWEGHFAKHSWKLNIGSLKVKKRTSRKRKKKSNQAIPFKKKQKKHQPSTLIPHPSLPPFKDKNNFTSGITISKHHLQKEKNRPPGHKFSPLTGIGRKDSAICYNSDSWAILSTNKWEAGNFLFVKKKQKPVASYEKWAVACHKHLYERKERYRGRTYNRHAQQKVTQGLNPTRASQHKIELTFGKDTKKIKCYREESRTSIGSQSPERRDTSVAHDLRGQMCFSFLV